VLFFKDSEVNNRGALRQGLWIGLFSKILKQKAALSWERAAYVI
jgi:hypothetical protein